MKNIIDEKCKKCGRRIGWIELVGSFALACFKLFIGIVSKSHALIGSAFYSIQDMISAGIVIFSAKYSSKNVDDDHPYGYGKIEFIGSVFLSVGIIVGGLFLFFVAGKSIITGPKHVPGFMAFWAATIVFFTNELLYRFSRCAGTTLNSPAILSNAAHTRVDSISAACVAIGIIISKLGFVHIDPIIAIFEVVHVVVTSVSILNKGFKGLMDASLPEKEVKIIEKVIRGTEGIKDIVYVRTRELGQHSQVDMEISLDPGLSLADAKPIIEKAKNRLTEAMPKIGELNISFVPDRPDLLEKKEKIVKVRKILSDYYRQFIENHSLKIIDSRINLTINVLPGISLTAGQGLRNQIQKRIEEEIPDNKIFVELTPTKGQRRYN